MGGVLATFGPRFDSLWLIIDSLWLTLAHFGKLGKFAHVDPMGHGIAGQEIPFFSVAHSP